ncbi:MAG: PEP-CTERM sorting domain-containing protein [Candidatus Omnitrophica bacterium]|nr:PEP-CTERM sorting domain-containing protein [Candidatus Omnitrophota bacterium]
MKFKLFLVALISLVVFTPVYASTVTLSGDVVVDRQFTVWINDTDANFLNAQLITGGSSANPDPDSAQTHFSTQLTPGHDYYLTVLGAATITNLAGFIGDFTLSGSGFKFANGTQYLLSNATDWTVRLEQFDFHNFGVIDELAYDGQGYGGKWNIDYPNIDNNAKWIWTNGGNDLYCQRFFTTKITATPEPISSALFLLGGAALVGLRKRRGVR